MSTQHLAHPDLPELMSWEELAQLPKEIAQEIELWDGRVVWAQKGPPEHQAFSAHLYSALRRFARKSSGEQRDNCWESVLDSNVFLTPGNKSDFLTPDFLICKCRESSYDYVYAHNVVLAGEVLSPSNTTGIVEAKKERYAAAGIPWYWEVRLAEDPARIASVRAYARQDGQGTFADKVKPLYPGNYVLVGKWLPEDHPEGISIDYPFLIRIPWSELEY